MTAPTPPIRSIAIIGAGIIGLSCAIELADRGVEVSLYDQKWPPRGASWAAAGMLAPAYEAAADADLHPSLFALCVAGAEAWPRWAQALEARSGLPSGYHPGPTLAVAQTETEVAALTRLIKALEGRDDAAYWCDADLQRLEPALTEHISRAALLPSDGQAENRLTLAALLSVVSAHPRINVIPEAAPLTAAQNSLDHAGQDATLVTAGWASGAVQVQTENGPVSLSSFAPSLDLIRPFGGQMLSVERTAYSPSHPIRHGDLYVVPKQDRIVIGATTEPDRVLKGIDQDMIEDLRLRAISICPGLADAEVIDAWAGVRPGTADHAPLLGLSQTPNLFLATGHFRNGILLAPMTARLMADLILDQRTDPLIAPFAPQLQIAAEV